ncbi:GNAT family N-acetyltransferase [Gordonia sp. CPCC 205515]|uniref:GNAT family N-acetyltransferase n=1 Tax=Gordonia sp. CPCC 205515 TaxID=3140791 RepID=UPI003AF3CE6A
MPDITVTATEDVDLVSSLLAQAFAADPVVRWLNDDPRRDTTLFRTLARWAHGPAASMDLALRDGAPIGAAMWDPPGHKITPMMQIRAMPGFIASMRGQIRRGLILEETFLKLRPKEPHWYLGTVGAAVPGLGVGTALLRAGLDRLDGPAYLESSNPANVPLYERFGFEVVDEITLPQGGPPVWPMYRKG